MRILVTGARAPVALEWARILSEGGHEVWMCDSVKFPLAPRASQVVQPVFIPIPSPRWDFPAYASKMLELGSQVDMIIPTCEEIFYVAKVAWSERDRKKCLMPDKDLLYQLHHKKLVYARVPACTAIAFPKTTVLEHPDDLLLGELDSSILKPVYSRFGSKVMTPTKTVVK